ncbi:hypothetical protein ACM1RC_26725 [Paenibacillus azoreducens]|uniref:hypothetical protein n=1 Tax=Paenibacillus azoreducens TaxID=116718 RepID=UPI0039F49924
MLVDLRGHPAGLVVHTALLELAGLRELKAEPAAQTEPALAETPERLADMVVSVQQTAAWAHLFLQGYRHSAFRTSYRRDPKPVGVHLQHWLPAG